MASDPFDTLESARIKPLMQAQAKQVRDEFGDANDPSGYANLGAKLDSAVTDSEAMRNLAEASANKAAEVAAGLNFSLTGNSYAFGRRLSFARADSAGRLGDGIADDGTHFGKYAIRVNGASWTRAADGYWTLDLNALALTRYGFAGGGGIEVSSDRYVNGKRIIAAEVDALGRLSEAKLADGSVFIPKLIAPGVGFDPAPLTPLLYPKPGLVPLGDSLTAGGYADLVAATLGIPLLTASSVANDGTSGTAGGGIGSQRSSQIVARYGATGLSCAVQNNQLVSGANVLTAVDVALLSRHGDVPGAIRTLRATITTMAGAAIKGELRAVQQAGGEIAYGGTSYRYTFTPSAGQTLGAVPASARMTIDDEGRRDALVLCWIGNNDPDDGAGWQDRVKANIARVAAAYRPLTKRIVVIGLVNSRDHPSGSTRYGEIVALNAEMATLYPDYFCDVRPAYNAGTADDTPNPANTADAIHYNATGKQLIASVVVNFLRSKGWYA